MGLLNGKNHQPLPARDPRPKGAQKDVECRDTQSTGLFGGGQAKTPWLFAKSDKAVARDRNHPGI